MPYCLAKTEVNGEIVIQKNSETYSASASALASGATFREAAQVATIDSNTAATIAARAAVDNILLDYSYVLSDANITSMINNSLKTTIAPIRRLMLRRIATTVDGKNYILNKDTTIAENEYLLIPNGNSLTVDAGKFIFNNSGIISVGERRDPQTKGCEGCPTTNKDTATACNITPCCNATLCTASPNGGLILTTSTYGSAVYNSFTNYTGGELVVNAGNCVQVSAGITVYNYASITNSGCMWLSASSTAPYTSAYLINTTDSQGGVGAFYNYGSIYSDGAAA
jgi:hypothetical protein